VYRRYLASALGLARQGEQVLRQVRPTAVVVFNGLFYPESVLRSLARRMDIPVITHEVGLRPLSAYFSHQDATFRSLDLPANAVLSDAEDARLDRYLSDRLQGDFTMAGIRFWDGMEGLPGGLRERIAAHRQVVGVFGNVAFDTSQIHANTLFEDMFQWLDGVAEVIGRHPETLFVFRAHPDEGRPGKESQESLASWFRVRGLDRHRNAVLIPPHDPTSSYDIVHASKFVLVYSSSIGLEASILRVPVLCAGRARYTQVPAVLLPPDRDAYWRTLEMWLAPQAVPFEESWRRVARAFLYQELFQASLDLGEFVAADPTMPGMVQFAPFEPEGLRHASVIEVIRRGIQEGAPFLALPQAPTMEPGRA
jgi:hypothetical protein